MIKADHGKIARFFYDIYIMRQLRNNFSNFYMVNKLPDISAQAKLIIAPNHISWWDGFFIDFVMKKNSDRKLHVMMLERELKKYSFFRKIGAFSINPGSASSVRETARYINDIIVDKDNYTVIYPQGEIEQYEKRPLNLKKGLRLFLKEHPDALVLPAGFKIEYYNQKHPSVYCRFGKMIEAEKIVNDFKIFERLFYGNLDELSLHAEERKFNKDLFL